MQTVKPQADRNFIFPPAQSRTSASCFWSSVNINRAYFLTNLKSLSPAFKTIS